MDDRGKHGDKEQALDGQELRRLKGPIMLVLLIGRIPPSSYGSASPGLAAGADAVEGVPLVAKLRQTGL